MPCNISEFHKSEAFMKTELKADHFISNFEARLLGC